MKAIFCGTPEIAVPSLEALAEIAEIVGVVCQPDRPAGRGMKLRAPAVKEAALRLGFEVFQPLKVRDGSLAAWMRERSADVAVVIAYGRILTADTLEAPRLGCVNLHASLLPQYRGAAPIFRALLDGQEETGVCLMKMDEGMDTGDVLSVHRLAITREHDAGSLASDLGRLAAEVTRTDVPRYVRGELSPTPQAHELATYAPPLGPEDAALRLSQEREAVHNQVRALCPSPGAKATLRREGAPSKRLKVLTTALVAPPSLSLGPGEILVDGGRVYVGTASAPLEIKRAQLEGKTAQDAHDLINGRTLQTGDRLE